MGDAQRHVLRRQRGGRRLGPRRCHVAAAQAGRPETELGRVVRSLAVLVYTGRREPMVWPGRSQRKGASLVLSDPAARFFRAFMCRSSLSGPTKLPLRLVLLGRMLIDHPRKLPVRAGGP